MHQFVAPEKYQFYPANGVQGSWSIVPPKMIEKFPSRCLHRGGQIRPVHGVAFGAVAEHIHSLYEKAGEALKLAVSVFNTRVYNNVPEILLWEVDGIRDDIYQAALDEAEGKATAKPRKTKAKAKTQAPAEDSDIPFGE